MTTNVHSGLEALRDRVRSELTVRLGEHVARLDWTREQLKEHQRQQLRALLAHAVECSPFHARRLGGIDAERVDVDDLTALPVMTKAEMMANFDDVLTDDRLDLPMVQDHLDRSRIEPSLLLDRYVCLASGGSSGTRGVFVQTVGAYAEFVASLMRRPMAKMMASGAPPPKGLVIGLVAAASPLHSTGLGAATSGGPVRLVSAPATLPLAAIVERLNALQPAMLMGYPTKLAQLAAEQHAGRLRIAPQWVTATSEMLTEEDRASITAGFGMPVINQFASTEGLVGHSQPGKSSLVFASDMCLAELVDENNRPVEDHTAAHKVLVTNLHNHTQPLIRYELTDRFVRHGCGDDGHLRADAQGRADELFRYGDLVVHPLVVRTVMVDTPSVVEYQVRQTELGIQADVVIDAALNQAELALSLERSLRRAGLDDATVSVRVVDRIERHPETGKVRRFIPL